MDDGRPERADPPDDSMCTTALLYWQRKEGKDMYSKVVLSILGTMCIALTGCAQNIVLTGMDGFNVTIEKDRLKKLPEINIEKENPPITMTQAVVAAKEYILQRFPDAKEKRLQINDIRFSQDKYPGAPDVVLSMYNVTFRAYEKDEKIWRRVYVVLIAMDGKPLYLEDKAQDKNANTPSDRTR